MSSPPSTHHTAHARVSDAQRPRSWRQRAARLTVYALGVTLLAVLIALSVGKLLERHLAERLQGALEARGVSVAWAHSSWSLGEACVGELKWLHEASGGYGRVREACAKGGLQLAWPPLVVHTIRLHEPQLTVPLERLAELRALITPQSAPSSVDEPPPRSRGASFKRLLAKTITLELSQGELWLMSQGDSVLSAVIALNAQLGEDLERPQRLTLLSAHAGANVSVRGLERPLSVNARLSPEALTLTPRAEPWLIKAKGARLSCEGLTLTRSHQLIHLQDVTLELPHVKLRASLELAPLAQHLKLAGGSLSLSPALLSPAPVARQETLESLRALRGLLTPLSAQLASFKGALSKAQAPHIQRGAQEAQSLQLQLEALKLSVRGATSWEAELTSLSTSLPHLSSPVVHPRQLQGRLSARLSTQQSVAEASTLTLCWGRACVEGERAGEPTSWESTPWSLSLSGALHALHTLAPHLGALKAFKRLISLSELLQGRLSGALSLSLNGELTPTRRPTLTQAAVRLSEGRLKLSADEPQLSLPTLSLTASPKSALRLDRLQPLSRPLDLGLQLSLTSPQQRLQLEGGLSLKPRAETEQTSSLSKPHKRPKKDPQLSLPPLELSLKGGRLSCQEALSLLPQEALGQLESVSLRGSIEPRLKVSVTPQRLSFDLKGVLRRCTFEALRFQPLSERRQRQVKVKGRLLDERDVTWLNEPFSFEIDPALSGGERVLVGPQGDAFAPISSLPAYVGGAMYLTEEMGYWTGGAISPALIENALNINLKGGGFIYGGSTITQQLVKNLFLTRDKHLTRKLQEALISARLIDAVGKERLLELYLNCIEFGPGVFGIQAAARFYFQKSARELSPQEAVFLAMLKVSPKRGARWKRAGRSPSFTWWRARSVEVFERLVEKGFLSERQAAGQAPFVLTWSRSGDYLGAEQITP